MTAAWGARFKAAEVIEAKEKEGGFEIVAKDQWNDKYKVAYSADGKLVSESKHKLPLASVPAPVVEAAKKWAPAAKWEETAVVQTKKGEPSAYAVSGDLNGKIIKAEIQEDGKVLKADKLEEPKAEKKKEEKKEEKKEVKKEEKKEEKK